MLPNSEHVFMRSIEPGTLVLIGFVDKYTSELSDGRELRLVDGLGPFDGFGSDGSYYVIAYTNLSQGRPTSPLDEIHRDVLMVPNSILRTVPRSELPMFVNWHTGRMFAEMMKGESE